MNNILKYLVMNSRQSKTIKPMCLVYEDEIEELKKYIFVHAHDVVEELPGLPRSYRITIFKKDIEKFAEIMTNLEYDVRKR